MPSRSCSSVRRVFIAVFLDGFKTFYSILNQY
jgi:hypothetical protein